MKYQSLQCTYITCYITGMSCPSWQLHRTVQVGNCIELEAIGLQFEPYQWLPCGVTWDSSRTVVVIKLLRTSKKKNMLHNMLHNT